MKHKIVALTGLAWLSVACLAHAANIGDLDQNQGSKRWGASASFRGFYDDNYLTLSGVNQAGTFGFEVSPTISYNLPGTQTYLGAYYQYSLNYFNDAASTNQFSHNHEFVANLDHRFSSRTRLRLKENFLSSQEPDLYQNIAPSVYRTDRNHIHNSFTATFNAQLSSRTGVEASYNNVFDEYEAPALKGLNLIANGVSLEGRWQLNSRLLPKFGCDFRMVSYTAGKFKSDPSQVDLQDASVSDARSEIPYVGVEYTLNSKSTISVRVWASVGSTIVSPGLYIEPSGFSQKRWLSGHFSKNFRLP